MSGTDLKEVTAVAINRNVKEEITIDGFTPHNLVPSADTKKKAAK